jgi:hypothetical protein
MLIQGNANRNINKPTVQYVKVYISVKCPMQKGMKQGRGAPNGGGGDCRCAVPLKSEFEEHIS